MRQKQRIAPTAQVARGAVLVGDISLGEKSSVWYNAVARADNAPIQIGARSNIGLLRTACGRRPPNSNWRRRNRRPWSHSARLYH